MFYCCEEADWARRQFGGANLSDVRRVQRVVKLGRSMAENPGASIPELCETPYDVKATYNLFKHPEATPDNLQSGHRKLVHAQLRGQGVWLLVEDTSEFSWVTPRPIPGLGPTGNGNKHAQGFLLHSVLAVRWAVEESCRDDYRRPALEVVGLAEQLYEVRKPIPEHETGNASRERWNRERESHFWGTCSKHLGPALEGVRWVRVCDRGADIYEFLLECLELGHGFVVRASQDRALTTPKARLFDQARTLSAWGIFELKLRERPNRSAHTAKLAIAAMPISIRSPQRPGASPGKLAPVPCWVVRVWEMDPPVDSAPLEWILLTDEPTETLEAALTVALQYATRWIVEEFHKALKTGLGAQRLQLEDAHRLFAAISVMSVDALRLLDLRERLRVMPDAPAEEAGLDPLELEILSLKVRRKLQTVRDVALAIGRLGGHMNRKADGMPGMLTLWRGQKKLRTLVAGARLGSQLKGFG